MKILLFLTFLLSTTLSFSFVIPEKLLGRYETQVPDFEFENNGQTIKAAAYNVAVTLREDYLWYHCGDLKFYGVFTDAIENDEQIDIHARVSNDLSIEFDFELSINKKTKSLALRGLKGIPELTLHKHEIVLKHKG